MTANAIGGSGGNGFGNGSIGGNGAAAYLGQVSGSSSGGGNVTVTADLTGGSGGIGYNGGNGADASLTNALSGSTSGTLTLTQNTIAGSGGAGSGGSTGIAGNATSTLNMNQNGSAILFGSTSATGGSGGSNNGANGAVGGTAYSMTNVTGNAIVGATAWAAGGNGGASKYVGGNGGNATATAATNTMSVVIQLDAMATGGTGGSGNTNGLGGSAIATISANSLTVEQDSPASGQQGGYAYVNLGGGTLSVGNANTNNGILTLSGSGAAKIGGINGTGSLTIGDGSTSTILQLANNSDGSSQSALTINSGSMLDITNNHLLMNYGSNTDPVSTIESYLKTGYNHGAWNGVGINSSTAAANHGYGLGFADGADGVVTGLSSGQIEVAYTLLGDANLDGIVSGDDFTILASNLGKSVTAWDKGDFNYDGVVSGDDFTALVSNLGKKANGADVVLPASDFAAIDAFAAANGLMADVPEPGSVTLLGFAGLGILMRRRRAIHF